MKSGWLANVAFPVFGGGRGLQELSGNGGRREAADTSPSEPGRAGRCEEWQLRQAEHALRLYFVNFLRRTDWHRHPPSAIVDEHGGTDPIAALEQLRLRIRTRHYSYPD